MRVNFSDRYRFSDWPNDRIPQVAAGVYAIWHADKLIYCGMSGRGIERAVAEKKKKYGLITRLGSHASGRLSGDQFCVYVANRLVIPTLSEDDLPKFSSGELRLDTLTKKFIHDRLDYQFVVTGSSRDAFEMEKSARRGNVFNMKPLLNPLKSV